MPYKKRHIQDGLLSIHAKDRGRLLVVTGARQVGKSTLCQHVFPDHDHVSMDDPQERTTYLRWSAQDWLQRSRQLVIDEVQKAPELFHTVKACYDRDPQWRCVLLGSSQVLMMKGIRESLAGRAAIRELYPLSLAECSDKGQWPSLLHQLLTSDQPSQLLESCRDPAVSLGAEQARTQDIWQRMLEWGGMPLIHHPEWTDTDRQEWLSDYARTFLQRDLADLARLDRLEPFVRAQRVAAERSGGLLNYADLARQADISGPTAKNFMHYLELSYQVTLLKAWHKNREKRLSKMPKLHFLDAGVRRAVSGISGTPSGNEYESSVVAEVIKVLVHGRLAVDTYHLRTNDGREVDLLLETPQGYVAIEVKNSQRVGDQDARHLRNLHHILGPDKPLLFALVVSAQREVMPLLRDCDHPYATWAVPATLLFGADPFSNAGGPAPIS